MEVSFEITSDDYAAIRRIEKQPPWALILACLIMLPSLGALWWGGFRTSLAIVAVVLAMLIYSGLRAAERLRKKRFERHRCAQVTVRADSSCLEIDEFITWRRLHWAYLEEVEITEDWLSVSFYEGERLLIPPRAWEEVSREDFLTIVKEGLAHASSREVATLESFTEFDDEKPLPTAQYKIDEDYMRQLVDLRFTDKIGFVRVAVVAFMTYIAAQVWKSMARQIVAAGVAVGLPMVFMRLLEIVMRQRALRRSQMAFELEMTLALHDDGYERRCRLFQNYTAWSMVSAVNVNMPYVVISHSDDEHLLIPFGAWDTPEDILQFHDASKQLRESVHEEMERGE